ncbi:MAG: hypothetical protein PHD48_07445 [Alphaproteobacteria bacterium]|nr:hypothetical protein [Alphaproteobacteria bacterium]
MMQAVSTRKVKPSFDVNYMGASTASEETAGQTAAFIFKGIEHGTNGHTGTIAFVCQANVFHGDKGTVKLYFSPKAAQAMRTGLEGALNAANAVHADMGAAVSICPKGSRTSHETFVPAKSKADIAAFFAPQQKHPRTCDRRKEARMRRQPYPVTPGPQANNG